VNESNRAKSVCRGCAKASVRPFFDLGELPLAGGFLTEEQVASEQRYPLVVSVCEHCGLVQIVSPVDPAILFQDYSFATGTIPGLVKHFGGYAQWISDTLGPQSVIEFGCNDGTLIAALEERGIRSLGVDLAANITEMARAQGRNVLTGAFGPPMVAELQSQMGQVDVVTGSNVFAHNADPVAILEAADSLLAPEGVLCLEVMYAGDLLDQLQWDTLYHEHLTFYSLGTLGGLLGRYGFEPISALRIPMHGGSLRLAAARRGRRRVDGSVADLQAWEGELSLNEASTWDGFTVDCRRRIDAFADTMRRLSEGASIWGYGAAGKATMWVNVCEMDYLEALVDASPLRFGKLMPGTHTPIVSPEEFARHQPDYVFVSAWNYLDAIRANEPDYAGYWIVPLPEMRIE
jgi:SAM-dependent methyltransferase